MSTFEEVWRERFEGFARRNSDDHLVSGWSERGLRRRLALFEKLLREQDLSTPAEILDLGCGAGTYVRFLTSRGYNVVGLDYSLPSLYLAHTADHKQNGHYVVGEAYNLPFCKENYDLVVSIGVLQVLERPEGALDEIVRVLRPKGLLAIEFLNAFELVTVVKTAGERLRGRLPRVRTYSHFKIKHQLSQRGIRIIRQVGVYLPPRWFPWLEPIFNIKWLVFLLETLPGFSLLCAHAFMVIGEKVQEK